MDWLSWLCQVSPSDQQQINAKDTNFRSVVLGLNMVLVPKHWQMQCSVDEMILDQLRSQALALGCLWSF